MSVFSAKSNFLQSQINGILAQPLTIDQRAAVTIAPDIPEAILYEAVDEVNIKATNSFAAAYFPLAIQSVAQQIDQLYWEDAAPHENDEEDLSGPQISTNFATASGLETLPDTWDELPEYAEKLARLKELHVQRDALRTKRRQLDQLHSMLRPLNAPQQSIQPSLVTRDGVMADEVSRTRMLTNRMRVQAAQGGLPQQRRFAEDEDTDTGLGEDDVEADGRTFDPQRKLRALLNSR